MTIREVADIAGVSPASVSRYFNGGSLGDDKRERIARVVRDTGFRPNAAARAVRTGKSGQIGVIVPQIGSDSMVQIMAGVERELGKSGETIIFGCTDGKSEKELKLISTMQENGVDGILLMAVKLTPELRSAIEECEVPLVVTGQNFPGLPCVYHDDCNAMRELTELVIARNRRRILYLGVDDEDPAAGQERLKGVKKACDRAGITDDELHVCKGGFTFEEGRRAVTDELEKNKDYNAVICASDYAALGAIRALTDAGLNIPGDVSVVGIGDNWAGELVKPGLTSAHLYYDDCGATATRMLKRMIEKGRDSKQEPVKQVKLGYTITERGSV